MKVIYVLFLMIFFHIIDDFGLQGIMASMKQKSWWENQNGYSDFYARDYVPALLCHAFSWSMTIHIPALVYFGGNIDWPFFCANILVQFLIHAFVDNSKANQKKINLVMDQSFHMAQIVLSWLLVVVM